MKVSNDNESTDMVSKVILVLADGTYDQIKISEDFPPYRLIPYGCWHIIKLYEDGSFGNVAHIDSSLVEIAKNTAEAIAEHFDVVLVQVPI